MRVFLVNQRAKASFGARARAWLAAAEQRPRETTACPSDCSAPFSPPPRDEGRTAGVVGRKRIGVSGTTAALLSAFYAAGI